MDIIWKLTSKKDNVDYTDIVVKIAKGEDINLGDYNVGMVESIVHSFKDEITDYILENGFSSLINDQPLLEHIVVQGADQNSILQAMHRYLDRVNIDNELIIVDPYFFPKNFDPSYPVLVEQILDKYLHVIDTLHIITKPRFNAALKNMIEGILITKKPALNILHKTSEDYHDRFWISNKREKGIITGTSLNGYGKSYALLDRLNTSDVRDIVASLLTNGLL